MKLQCCVPGFGHAEEFGHGMPVRFRLTLALAASIALHTAIVLAVHPSSGVSQPHGYAFTARLAPAPADERRDSSAPLQEPSASPPARDALQAAAPAAPQDLAGPPQPAPRYYLASELERQPSPLNPVEPENPPDSGTREGYVVLRLFINERGLVDEALVVSAEPRGVFEKSALAAFGSAQFSPGMRSGAAVKSQLLVEVRYRLEIRATSGRGY